MTAFRIIGTVTLFAILFSSLVYFGWDIACGILESFQTCISVLIARIKSHVFYISVFVLIVEKVRNYHATLPDNLEPSRSPETASPSSSCCSGLSSATRSSNICSDVVDGPQQTPEPRPEARAAQANRESAKMKKLKMEIREAFLNIVPSNVLPALVKNSPQLLTPDDVAHIEEVSTRQGGRAGAADLLERLSRYQGWLPYLTNALQDPTVKSEERQIQMGNQIGQLTSKLEQQKERHSANIYKLQMELEENRQITLRLTSDVGVLQQDQRSQDARLVQLEKEFLSKMKDLNRERSILQSLEGQHQNIQNLLRVVVREAQPLYPTYDEEIQKSIRYVFECLINPDTVLGTFHKYDTGVLVQQDLERVRAITTNYGKTRGASELLDILPRYKNWFQCLVKVLEDPGVQQGHVAKMMKDGLGPAQKTQAWVKRGPQAKLDKSRFDQQNNKTFNTLKRQYVHVKRELDVRTREADNVRSLDKRSASWHRICRFPDADQAPTSAKRKRPASEPSSRPTLKTRLDLLLIGKTGNGKSSTGNSILGHNVFAPAPSSSNTHCDTFNPDQAWVEVDEYRIRVVDGLTAGDTRLDNMAAKEKARNDVTGLMKQFPEGFHTLMLVLRFGEEYTQEEQEVVRMLKCIFKEDVVEENCVVVFTHGERFDAEFGGGDTTFKDWLSQQTGPLKSLVNECRGRCVLFRNAADDEGVRRNQMLELLQMFRQINQRRVGYFLKPGSPRRANPEQALDLLLTCKNGSVT